MKSPTSLKHLIRYAAGSMLLVANAVFPLPSFATSCDGGPKLSDVRMKDGALWVRGKFGQSATTSDMGKTWSIGEKQVYDSESEFFWNKIFVSNDDMYQNLPVGHDRSIHVITKKKNAALWEESSESLILFGKDNQLFSFTGKLTRLYKSVRLHYGEIYGTASSPTKSSVHIEVSESYLCKISPQNGTCLNPHPWNSRENAVTGFFALENGDFFLSTSNTILHFDAKADLWSHIYPPQEWELRCNS